MVDLTKLSTAISTITGGSVDAATYETLLVGTGLETLSTFTKFESDEAIYTLSDVEIQEIIEKLNAYADTLPAESADLEAIYALTEALHEYMKGDGDTTTITTNGRISRNSDTFDADIDDQIKSKNVYDRSRAASTLATETLIGDDNATTHTDYEKWLDTLATRTDDEAENNNVSTLKEWFSNLSTDEQIAVLEYYKDSDNTTAITNAVATLNEFQKGKINTILDADPDGDTYDLTSADIPLGEVSTTTTTPTTTSDEDITLEGNVKAFKELTDTLPLTDNAGDDIAPADSIKDFFDKNTNSKEEIFTALADGNSDLYASLGGDVDEIMEYFWQYLAENPSEQKDFLSQIPPYSPVHLSLMQTLSKHNANLDDDDDVSTAEKSYWKALQDLSDGIGESDLSGVSLAKLFPEEDDDITPSDVVDDIFGNVSDIVSEGGTSVKLGEFIAEIKAGNTSEADIKDFIDNLSPEEFADFTEALTSDSSPVFALLKEEDGSETVDTIMNGLFAVLGDNLDSKNNGKTFLQNINQDGKFFEYLSDMGHDDIVSAIEDETIADLDDKDITAFFEDDISKVTKAWYGTEVADEYLKDLSDAADSKEIDKILNTAEDEGVLESVLYAISSDNFDNGSAEFYNQFFKVLKSDSSYADIFMQSIAPDSNLGRSLMQLSDNKTKPFDDISYSINKDTGNLDFGSDERKLLGIIADTDMVGANTFFESLDTIQSDYEDAVGTDNSGISDIIANAQTESLDDATFDDIFASVDDEGVTDSSNAEEILSFIADDDSVIFKDLGEEQLAYFMDKFLAWISTQDSEDNNLLDSFVGNIDADSLLYKALIKAGADSDDFDNGDYKSFINGATKTDDAAQFIKQSLKFSSGDNEGLGFISETLRDTKGNEVDDAVTKIIDYATSDPAIMEDLVADIASGGDIISGLEVEQAEALIKAVFAYVADDNPEDAEDAEEDISELQLLFIDNITEGSLMYKMIQNDYPAIADYLDITIVGEDEDEDEDEEYDDKDVANELKKLLNDKDLIVSYSRQSNSANETSKSQSSSSNTSDTGGVTLKEDDDMGSDGDSASDSARDSARDSDSSGFENVTEAALAGLSKTLDITGEPDENNVLSSYFFEEHSVKDITKAAIDGNFDIREIIGTLQLIPLDKQPDFIREYMASGNPDEETKNYLLGRVLIMITNGEIGDRTSEAILKDAGITNLDLNTTTNIMDSWADSVNEYTDSSISSVDEAYEKVITAAQRLEGGTTDEAKVAEGTVPPPTDPNNPYGMNPYGSPYGSPYGASPYGASPYGNPYGMSPYGVGGMGMIGGMGMMGGIGAYNAGFTDGMNVGAYNAGFSAGLNTINPAGNQAGIVININTGSSDASVNSGGNNEAMMPAGGSTQPVNTEPTANAQGNKEAIKAKRQADKKT